MQNIQQEFVLHAFKSDGELRNELSEHPLHLSILSLSTEYD